MCFSHLRCMQFFCNNELILTDTNVKDPMEGIPDTAQYRAANQALISLGIHQNYFVHTERVLEFFAVEINEDDSEDRWHLGNWDPKIQEARYSSWYSTKLPMKIIR